MVSGNGRVLVFPIRLTIIVASAVLVGVLLALAWIFFSLRLYVKAFITKGWGLDDVFLCAGVVSSRAHKTLDFF